MVRRGLGVRVVGFAAAVLIATTTSVSAQGSGKTQLVADLDGAPMKVADVGKWFCQDFNYPAIHCFSDPADLDSSTASLLAVTAIDYVTVYELTGFAGSFMHMSQDYTALLTIGWNDRISSLKGRNSEHSHFFGDWFYGGSNYSVCCNSLLTTLGSYDNTFSSVHRD